eukprot:2872289-Rhodomonas_salina.1
METMCVAGSTDAFVWLTGDVGVRGAGWEGGILMFRKDDILCERRGSLTLLGRCRSRYREHVDAPNPGVANTEARDSRSGSPPRLGRPGLRGPESVVQETSCH